MFDAGKKPRAPRAWRYAFATALIGAITLSAAGAQADEWKWKRKYYRYGPPGVVYVAPPPVRYYAPPPRVVYAPRPVVVYPEPMAYAPAYPAYYGPPGGSLSFGLNVPLP